MADEESFESIPIVDRFTHKVWKARKSGYEAATKIFEKTPDESDDAFRPFLLDSSLWKAAVTDSNVAAQQEGIIALNAFLKFGGREACVRSRGTVVTGLVEKALASARAATKTNAVEALLLYVEGDVSGPIIEDLLPGLSNKQPKIIAATLAAFTAIFHNYGCKIVDPKPVLKGLPKAFGHADKNVRAEATNLAVELYRWLREAMKPMFWADLKPTQQSDLESQFEKVKSEPAPKQERLLRTQQEALAQAPAGGDDDEAEEEDIAEEAGEVDVFDLAEPQDILKGLPANFYDGVASSKWKERKEAVEALFAVANVPRIKDADFSEINRCLAKCMKDANVAVVTQAAQCIEALAKGLRQGYAKYRPTVMQPIMERLKEKKVTVADALGAALDAVFAATSLTDCMEDIIAFLGNKNPQVKEGTMKFLVRCLRTTRSVPAKPEIQQMVDAAKKLLSESSEGLRSGGAEILGTIMKIIGERPMKPHLEGLDDIRKNKITEFFETAEVKAKDKPKPPPPAPKAAPAPKKVVGGARKAPAKKAAPSAAASRVLSPEPAPPPAAVARPAARAPAKLSGLKATRGRPAAGPSGLSSPRKPAAAPIMPEEEYEEEPAPPPATAPRSIRGGLAGRSLTKPGSAPIMPPESPTTPSYPGPTSGFTAIERAELEELRVANERLTRLIDDMKQDRSKLLSENQELKNQNASLIEDHTRDVLSIKAKETQLVRARSDAEATEQTNERLRRELDRLKRALSRAEGLGTGGAVSPVGECLKKRPHDLAFGNTDSETSTTDRDRIASPTHDDAGLYRDAGRTGPGPSAYSRPDSQASRSTANGNRISYASNLSEEKENGEPVYARAKLSPGLGYGSGGSSGLPSGRASPARGYRQTMQMPSSSLHNTQNTDDGSLQGNYGDRIDRHMDRHGSGGHSSMAMDRMSGMNSVDRGGTPTGGVESWKRAAEVTSQLKARIEQMKAKQGFRQ
ncbi:Spindle pole body component alp14 [Ceratocystis lukuohia]|uniref:Spindle pole body component alp14 n=1 Tax=Ceratocystis lukuohia TaxID=2019550 RepID=A0ABR4MUT9_9PEZI